MIVSTTHIVPLQVNLTSGDAEMALKKKESSDSQTSIQTESIPPEQAYIYK